MNSLNFLYIIYFISIVMLAIGMIVKLSYLIPLQIKQARVVNGLKTLRKLMLVQNIMHITVGTFAILTLVSRFFISGEPARYIIVSFVLGFAVFYLAFTVVWVIMYKQQFNPEQKRLHQKIVKEEEKKK